MDISNIMNNVVCSGLCNVNYMAQVTTFFHANKLDNMMLFSIIKRSDNSRSAAIGFWYAMSASRLK